MLGTKQLGTSAHRLGVLSGQLKADAVASRQPQEGVYHAARLQPGDDLKQALLSLLKNAKAQAMAVVTCVGSLRTVHLRLAGASATSSGKTLNLEGRYEVVSLVGTIGSGEQGGEPSCHLHISIGDEDGAVVGGHISGPCEVLTTAEVVLLELPGLIFNRVMDSQTGFKELCIERR
mmetsp:Transcript_31941/g.72874  ORF Transcript_31941/g.72874 Transcript_31941/m.72874 type:complete len:176 (-) Transcript_31941:239-766(-)